MEAPLWKADAGTQSIVRNDRGIAKQIMCSDKEFDNFTCTTDVALQKEIKKLQDLSYQCEKWRPGTKLTVFGYYIQDGVDNEHLELDSRETGPYEDDAQ